LQACIREGGSGRPARLSFASPIRPTDGDTYQKACARGRGVRRDVSVSRVGLATYRRLPNLSADDRLVVPALAAFGLRAEAVVWDQPDVPPDVTAVVIRSCWDYHLRIDEFLSWLSGLEHRGVRVLNPPPLIRWNADKHYLLDLSSRGVATVPTRVVRKGERGRLAGVLAEAGFEEAVVKPAVSASAHATWRTSRASAQRDDSQFQAALGAGDVLVQPLISAVATQGEWSVICFGGTPSHAVLKRPAAGDWRVQSELGGTAELRAAPPSLVDDARRVLSAAGAEQAAYARVDGYLDNDRLVLMELELIEPQLFLDLEPEAPSRFAGAIAATLRS
jgi:glutathione synthase/RimK-type ligase-like ATP-grasp enzyme